MFAEKELRTLYIDKGLSIKDIGTKFSCSPNKVRYWMQTYQIPVRSISEAIYLKNNPNGDPFVLRKPTDITTSELYGFGLGLYWGEGTKADKVSVRLGNSDPGIIRKFMEFLIVTFGVDRKDFKFALQLFNDIDPMAAMDFWLKNLRISKHQFYKSTISKSVSQGTYRKKAQYGVLTVYYHNKKLRDLLVSLLPM